MKRPTTQFLTRQNRELFPALHCFGLPFENVAVKGLAEGVNYLMWVITKTHGTRNHGVTNVRAIQKVRHGNGFPQRNGLFGANILTGTAINAVCRRVINAEFTALKIEFTNRSRRAKRRT